jgi:hypothetical protein
MRHSFLSVRTRETTPLTLSLIVKPGGSSMTNCIWTGKVIARLACLRLPFIERVCLTFTIRIDDCHPGSPCTALNRVALRSKSLLRDEIIGKDYLSTFYLAQMSVPAKMPIIVSNERGVDTYQESGASRLQRKIKGTLFIPLTLSGAVIISIYIYAAPKDHRDTHPILPYLLAYGKQYVPWPARALRGGNRMPSPRS